MKTLPVPSPEVAVKRIYDAADPSDGVRLLVDRLWPRGVSRERAALDGWLKELAPSPRLRTWFGHDPARWEEFSRRYREELKSHRATIEALRRLATARRLTLLHASRDRVRNGAQVLKALVEAG